MKKFIKTLSLLLVICFSIFAVACSKTESAVVSNLQTPVMSDTGNEQIAENVNSDESNSTESTTLNINDYNGIYKYTSNKYSFSDKYFEDAEKLINFFNTKDLNGVHYAVNQLGFNEFLSNIIHYSTYNLSKAVLINNGQVFDICYYNSDKYTYIDKTNYYTITAEKDGVSTNRNDIKFEINEEQISIYYQFTYVDDNNQTINTPLYIKTTLEKQPNTSNLFTGKAFTYKADSLTLNISPVSKIEEIEYLKMLSEIAVSSIDNAETLRPELLEQLSPENILSTLETQARQYIFNLLDDFSIKAEVNNSFFTYINNNGIYESNNLTGIITSGTATQTTYSINFEIILASDATLTFTLIAK